MFGSGLGHVTRVLDISERLRGDGDVFRFSCSAQALNYLEMHEKGREMLRSPSLDVEWTEGGASRPRTSCLASRSCSTPS